ncbi:MAG: TIGR04076 family protein [Deltaproteobacteria bacterium]|nr:TIGR04076 family protein [Deltaproteobacteria bacterium]MBW2306002.1 TIGR04076 family protein [Deltaproteobacteria bacterium]
MQNVSKVKITVLKRLNHEEIFGGRLQEVADTMTSVCNRLEDGQIFTVEMDGQMPTGFCTWAWHDIVPEITTLRFGGNFPWMKEEGMIYSCCSDGARPVIFKLERAD